MIRRDGSFWWIAGRFGFLFHDDGWDVVNRRWVVIASGRAPNTGYRRKWWRRK